MCPACLATLAIITASTASAGGLTALVVKKIRGKAEGKPAKGTLKKKGGNVGSPKNSLREGVAYDLTSSHR